MDLRPLACRSVPLLACALLGLALVGAPPASGGTPPEVVCGQIETGVLGDTSDVHEYTFQGVAGDLISVVAWRTDGPGTFAVRYEEPDGSGPADLFFRQPYTLLQSASPGTPHRIFVDTRSGQVAPGPYALQLTWLSERAECQRDLPCGSETAATFTSEWQWEAFSYDVRAGHDLAIQAWRTGGDPAFAPRYRIYRPDGSPVQTAFEDGLPSDPRVTADTDGIHTVVVKPEGSEVGDFAIKRLLLGDPDEPGFAPCGPALACGVPVAGLGDDTDVDPVREWQTFLFPGTPGEVVGLGAWAEAGADPDFVPEHRVFDRTGAPLGDFAEGFASWALPAGAGATGTYTAVVRNRESPGAAGDFALELQRLSGGQQCGDLLACGEVVARDLVVPGAAALFELDGVAGDTIAVETLALEGEGFTPEARLFAPDGGASAAFRTGRFEETLAQDGTHAIVVRATSPTALGRFSLFWEGLGPVTLCEATDADGDTIPDDADNCPTNPNPGQEDGDGDSVGDDCDNCPDAANAGQEDADGDSFGDACEPSAEQVKCLDKQLKALGKLCKSAFSCEAKRVKNALKDPTGLVRDACLDKAEEKFDTQADKARSKFGPCLMSVNLLTVATSVGADALALSGDALLGWDEFDPADSKTRSGIVKAMAQACFTHAKSDAKSVKKGTPPSQKALPSFSAKCGKQVARANGTYDGAGCANLTEALEILFEDVSETARGR